MSSAPRSSEPIPLLPTERRVPTRRVHQDDALEWLRAHPAPPTAGVVTSLPDVAEMPELDFDAWRRWFDAAVKAVLEWTPDAGVAVFFQTDVLQRGVWTDKSYLVLRAAESTGHALVWHKIVCRVPPGSVRPGRAGYSHLVCLSRTPRPAFRSLLPDVLPDAGQELSVKAMGARACELSCRYLLEVTRSPVVVDPFCGRGTVLAVANALGLDAIGVDRNARCCRAARKLALRLPDGP
jgi:hypothetical protein